MKKRWDTLPLHLLRQVGALEGVGYDHNPRRAPLRRSSSGTVHMERNGVYVSSDDEDDDFTVVKDDPRRSFARSPGGSLSHSIAPLNIGSYADPMLRLTGTSPVPLTMTLATDTGLF